MGKGVYVWVYVCRYWYACVGKGLGMLVCALAHCYGYWCLVWVYVCWCVDRCVGMGICV